MIHGGENLGTSGNSTGICKPLESTPPVAAPIVDAAASATCSGSDHPSAALGEIVVPEGNPGKGVPTDDNVERSGNEAMGETARATAAAQGPCPTGAVQPTAAVEGREGETRKEKDPGSASILAGESGRSARVVTDTVRDMQEEHLEEGTLGPTGAVMTATAEGGGEDSDSPQPARPESRSLCEAVETLGGRPDTAGDKDSGMKSKGGRDELTSKWNERKMSRTKSKRSVSAGSRARSPGKARTSAGGTSTVSEAPANTPHLQVL